jgi:hypothetical protein
LCFSLKSVLPALSRAVLRVPTTVELTETAGTYQERAANERTASHGGASDYRREGKDRNQLAH